MNQPYSRPEATAAATFGAVAAADLDGLRRASSVQFYAEFVSYFGEQKRQRVNSVYEYAYRLGLPHWEQYNRKAQVAAATHYNELHDQVTEAGRAAFADMPVEQRMDLIEDRAKYETFIFDAGLRALSETDRRRIEDPQAFREGRDRARFVQRGGWELLSAEDRTALGDSSVLSPEPTPAKVAFIDRAGLRLLSKEMRLEIEAITRANLADAVGFRLKHGPPLAKAFLERGRLQFSGGPCSFSQADYEGSLLKGGRASCAATVFTPSSRHAQPLNLTVSLEKVGFNWLLRASQPQLYRLEW